MERGECYTCNGVRMNLNDGMFRWGCIYARLYLSLGPWKESSSVSSRHGSLAIPPAFEVSKHSTAECIKHFSVLAYIV
jgi:hypothetical protein